MKTETNLYLRSLVEKQRADLLNERSCIINRISGSTMSDDEIEDAAFNLSEIGQKIRDFDDALTALRSEESQKQPCSAVPPLSEKTVEFIRQLLKISLDCDSEMSRRATQIPPLLSFSEEREHILSAAKAKVCEASTALNEFAAAYLKKSESK